MFPWTFNYSSCLFLPLWVHKCQRYWGGVMLHSCDITRYCCACHTDCVTVKRLSALYPCLLHVKPICPSHVFSWSGEKITKETNQIWSEHGKMKIAVFWVVSLCSLVEVYQCFRGPCCFNMTHCPVDGGSKDLWNVGKLLPDYTALQPRRQPSSYSPPWESQILLGKMSLQFEDIYGKSCSSFNVEVHFCQFISYFSCWSTGTLCIPSFHTLFTIMNCPLVVDYVFWLRIDHHQVFRLYCMFQCK
jgi:hypothetical protein